MASNRNISLLHYRILCYILLNVYVFSCNICATFTNFSSKTPYELIHPPPAQVQVDELYHLKDVKGMSCSAVQANAVLRHGARYPGLDDIDDISTLHEKLVAAMDPTINPELYKWMNRFSRNDSDTLSPLGVFEQKSFGRRLAEKLSSLFADKNLNYSFLVTSKERTNQSASAFYEGFVSALTGSNATENGFHSKINDQVLRFFSLCEKYKITVKDNKTAFKEYNEFLSNEKVMQIREKIHEKLKITNATLTAENVELIYTICGFETGLHNSSPWCSLLDENDVKILEYLGDLEHYCKNGYEYDITWQQSCPLVSKIFLTMDETIMDIESHRAYWFLVGLFGHAETLGPLYGALGLFKDSKPLRADNYDEQKNRLFRSSDILPFSANLMFILYQCVPEEFRGNETQKADYYLKLFVNEEPQLIPGCGELYCPYHVVRQRYSNFVDHCNFAEICKKPEGKDSGETLSRPLKEIYLVLFFLLRWKFF